QLPRSLGALEGEGAEARHHLVAIGDPVVAAVRKVSPFTGRPEDSGAGPLGDGRRVTKVIAVGDDDCAQSAEGLEVCGVVRRKRQRIDGDVSTLAYPQDTVKVEVALLVEERPAPEVVTMQSLHRGERSRARHRLHLPRR